jgi:ribosomal protein S18 acetylase RimI-like enzyme
MVTFAAPDKDQLHSTHQEAFDDYHLDMSYMTEERIFKRCHKNNVDFSRSIAAFDGNRMVGFTLIGIDQWQGEPAAFDAATGIVPEYRGKGLARSMFDLALPGLRERGVRRFLLEVLQPNHPAISVYEKTGFKIKREFVIYDVQLATADPDLGAGCDLSILPVGVDTILEFEKHADWVPSWENSFNAVDRVRDDLIGLGAFDGSRCVGVLAYYTTLNWVMSLVVDRSYRRRGAASKLLATLFTNQLDQHTKIKLNNVDMSDKGMMEMLDRAGFVRVIEQFEMELLLD